MEWWITEIGDNMLKGVVGDSLNPYRLDNSTIVEFFRRIPASRSSYQRLRGSLLEEERERIDILYQSAGIGNFRSPEENDELFQRRVNANPSEGAS